jgi:lysozyme family protein
MAKFEEFAAQTLKLEGGYQQHISDDGNYNSLSELVGTNYGISAPTLERYLGYPPTVEDMKNLDEQTALEIYRRYYWENHRLDEFNSQLLANIVGDGIVHHGPGNSFKNGGVRLLQSVLNDLGESLSRDGVLGSFTLAAANRQANKRLDVVYNKYRQARKEYYYDIVSNDGTKQIFLEGWLDRLDTFPVMEQKNEETPQPPGMLTAFGSGFAYFLDGLFRIDRPGTPRREWGIVVGLTVLVLVVVWVRKKK